MIRFKLQLLGYWRAHANAALAVSIMLLSGRSGRIMVYEPATGETSILASPPRRFSGQLLASCLFLGQEILRNIGLLSFYYFARAFLCFSSAAAAEDYAAKPQPRRLLFSSHCLSHFDARKLTILKFPRQNTNGFQYFRCRLQGGNDMLLITTINAFGFHFLIDFI